MWSHWVYGNLLQQQKELIQSPSPSLCTVSWSPFCSVTLCTRECFTPSAALRGWALGQTLFPGDNSDYWVTQGSSPCCLTVLSVSLWREGQTPVSFFFFLFFWAVSCSRVLGPQPEIEPVPLAVKVWSLNHWTIREVLPPFSLIFFLIGRKLLYNIVMVSAIV